jgi:rod shape determining protein RodA
MVAANTAVGPGAVTTRRGAFAAPWRHIDVTLVAAVISIAGIGVLMVYSATNRKLVAQGADPRYYLKRQALFIVLGLGAMVVTAAVDYRMYRDFAAFLYGATVLLLAAVISPLGASSKGHQAWFPLGSFQLQPSEMSKVALVICLAAYIGQQRDGQMGLRKLLTVLVLAGVPMGLIMLQPDIGTDLVFGCILAAALLIGGAKPRHLVILFFIAVLGVTGIIKSGVMQQYQVERLTAFLDQTHDTKGTSFNLQQSKIAIGSGGLTGKGLGRGTQTNLSYVPEQHTDFVFTVVGEELGFAGSSLLLVLFAFVVWRIWRAAALAKDMTGAIVCIGVLALLVFQVFENVGMTMGIMPITGIPLPFVSYGGSAMLAYFVGIGLVLNVHMRRYS